jgi:hypothetical protein
VEKNEFTDSIERYNVQLEIWTTLNIKMPHKISNSFAFSFSEESILIMGGITKKKIVTTPSTNNSYQHFNNNISLVQQDLSKTYEI